VIVGSDSVQPTVWHGRVSDSGVHLVRLLGGLSDPATRRDLTLEDLTHRLYMMGYAMLPHQVALACFDDTRVPGGYRLDTCMLRGEVRFRDQIDVPVRNPYLNYARQQEDVLYWPELPPDWYDPADTLAESIASCRCLLTLPTRAFHKAEVHFLCDKPHGFSEDSIQLAVVLTHLSVMAFENLELYENTRVLHQRLDAEMQQMQQLQRSLLPSELPEIPGFELATRYQPSAQTGGDYYDFFPLPGGTWGIVIADVSGHGAAAAVGMAMTRVLLHAYPRDDAPATETRAPSGSAAAMPPGRVLAGLNRALCSQLLGGNFVTAFYGVLDPAAARLTYACAGHNPGLLWRHDSRSIETLSHVGGVPLGLFDDGRYDEHTLDLGRGDVLLLYTDGVTDAHSPGGDLFDERRLLDALSRRVSAGPRPLIDGIADDVARFSHPLAATDDQTLVALRRHVA